MWAYLIFGVFAAGVMALGLYLIFYGPDHDGMR